MAFNQTIFRSPNRGGKMLSEYPDGDAPPLEQGSLDNLIWEEFNSNYDMNPAAAAPDLTDPLDWDRGPLWNHYPSADLSGSQVDSFGVVSISQDDPKSGANCMKATLQPYSGITFQCYTYKQDVFEWLYLHEVIRDELGFDWTYDFYNRMEFHVKIPPQVNDINLNPGVRNGSIGTYNRSVGYSRSDQASGEQGRLHYYHRFALPPSNGRWVKVIMDEHPNHIQGANGDVDPGNQPYPTLENDRNHYDSLTRFYFALGHQFHTDDGNDVIYYFDKFNLYRETRQENEEQVYTISGFYDPSNNRLWVGWQRNKADNDIIHEVRYSFQDIHDIGWNAANVAPNGSITPLGYGGYSSMWYDNSTISMGANTSIFVAIKPQNSNLFKQIQLDLT